MGTDTEDLHFCAVPVGTDRVARAGKQRSCFLHAVPIQVPVRHLSEPDVDAPVGSVQDAAGAAMKGHLEGVVSDTRVGARCLVCAVRPVDIVQIRYGVGSSGSRATTGGELHVALS